MSFKMNLMIHEGLQYLKKPLYMLDKHLTVKMNCIVYKACSLQQTIQLRIMDKTILHDVLRAITFTKKVSYCKCCFQHPLKYSFSSTDRNH